MRMGLFHAAMAVITIKMSALAFVGSVIRSPALFEWAQRGWAGLCLRAAGVRVRVTGGEHAPPDRAQVIVANHASFFDVWALIHALPVKGRFVAKVELARVPVMARAMGSGGHLFVDRKRPVRARRQIQDAARDMRERKLTYLLFPEGTRSHDGEVGRFKFGAFALAIEARVPLVPAYIQGGFEVWPRGRGSIRPREMVIHLAPPVPLGGAENLKRSEVAATVRRTMLALREKATDQAPRG